MFTIRNRSLRIITAAMASAAILAWAAPLVRADEEDGAIRPYRNNPWYWEYGGEPILLRGASDEDNLWQWTGEKLTDHLDLLVSVGGNYLRCTMSDRDEGNAFAYKEIEEGVYDLDQWNDEYWRRISTFLEETRQRGIVVQLTLWDFHDMAGQRFNPHPINPKNNITWEEGLVTGMSDFYGGSLREGKEQVLDLQKRYVTQLVSITLPHDHVLYNITNETNLSHEWENTWAAFLHEKAREFGKTIHVTSMHLGVSNGVRHVMHYRDLFSFAEISQNNQDFCGGRNRVHYDNVMFWRSMIASGPTGPMPMNNEKIYGATHYNAGTYREAEERFWRNIFAGAASVRFHRPAPYPEGFWGMGLSERAQINLRALDVFLKEFDIFTAVPYSAVKPLGMTTEAYALARMGEQYAVYFPAGRYGVELDPWLFVEELRIRWLDMETGAWSDGGTIRPDWTQDRISILHGIQEGVKLWTPTANPYIALIEVAR